MASENGPETQYFPNLSKSVINNPTITHVSGDMYSSSSPERYGLKLLLDNISVGAFHDAAERGDPPRCYPRTRTAIRSEIMEWIKAPNALRKLILWMHGPAGSGKTAIAQSIAEECKKKGLLAASFFFGRTAAGRNDSSRFIATIAYQLSQSIPEICEQMISAVEHNPTIFSLTLATQMQVLLVEPLKSLPPRSKPIFVITDGVDECGPDRNSQTKLLNLIATLISELQDIPFIFLISCRPEYEIREAFNGNSLSPIYKSLVLDDNYKPGKDIKLYLSSTFQEICNKHRRLGSRLPDPWPATADVDVIASKASGQFIFAVTVMKFVDSSRHDPQERLHDILHLSAPRNETPFAFLDTLYCSILSSVTDLSKVLDVLTLLILGDYPRIGIFPPILLTIEVAEALLGFAIGPVLVDMHALVFVPSDHDSAVFHSELRIHHASLYDFLTDESRSHEYYIDITQGNIELSRRWLKKIVDYYRRPLTPVLPPRLHFVDCINGFAIQCAKINTTSTAIADDLASLSLTQFLEEIRGDGHVYHAEWYDFFACVQGQAGTRTEVFPRLRNEFDAFVLGHLSEYPPPLQGLIPTIIVYGAHPHSGPYSRSTLRDIFSVSVYALGLESELFDPLGLDGFDGVDFHAGVLFPPLFEDRSRAGKYFVGGESYVTLAKVLVRIAGYRSDDTILTRPYGKHYDYTNWNWFPGIIQTASEDLELAALLRDRVLQYQDYIRSNAAATIAKVGLKYVERCGIPYLKHTHLSNTDRCAVCEEYGDTSSVVGTSNVSIRTLSSPISKHLSWADFFCNLTSASIRPFWLIHLFQTAIP